MLATRLFCFCFALRSEDDPQAAPFVAYVREVVEGKGAGAPELNVWWCARWPLRRCAPPR